MTDLSNTPAALYVDPYTGERYLDEARTDFLPPGVLDLSPGGAPAGFGEARGAASRPPPFPPKDPAAGTLPPSPASGRRAGDEGKRSLQPEAARIAHDALAAAATRFVDLIAEHFRYEAFFRALSRVEALAALRECVGDAGALERDHLPTRELQHQAAMVARAARWLPAILRRSPHPAASRPPSPASGRRAAPPLPLAGEGRGEGVPQ
jgi:hypothetical protein